MKQLIILLLAGSSLAALLSCSSSKKEALNARCDTTNVTYRGHILPVLQNNCYSCHSEAVADALGSRRVLEGYDNLMVYVRNGMLLSALHHDGIASFMPKNAAKLDDCTLSYFDAWVAAGAPNN